MGSHQDTKYTTKAVPAALDALARQTVDAAFRVHSTLGPGLLESVYEQCLCHELEKRGLQCLRQVPLPLHYDGLRVDNAFRVDVLVEDVLIVEVKAAEKTNPLHEAQLLTYLRLSGRRIGLLMNFNVLLIRDGIRRLIV
ncbi:MAG: GxxExxY protein [Caenispirillum bisanense]|nr:GxxExxY protein [Caenispirillum bisanense]MCA1973294.1 GxxExxY protein [Caenispirillum sp.]